MADSYIKILRKLLKWEWFNDSKMVHVFIYFLLSANHTSAKWRGIPVERGQLITGLNSISKSTGLSVRSIRTCIDRLKSTNEITINSTNKYSIISIVKYDDYQNFDNKSTKRTTSKKTNERQSNDNQTTTDNNDNNDNNEKKEYSPSVFLTLKEFEKLGTDFGVGLRDKALEYFSHYAKEKPHKFKEYKDHNLTIRRWVIDAVNGKTNQSGRKKITLISIQGSHTFELTDEELAEKVKSGYWKKA